MRSAGARAAKAGISSPIINMLMSQSCILLAHQVDVDEEEEKEKKKKKKVVGVLTCPRVMEEEVQALAKVIGAGVQSCKRAASMMAKAEHAEKSKTIEKAVRIAERYKAETDNLLASSKALFRMSASHSEEEVMATFHAHTAKSVGAEQAILSFVSHDASAQSHLWTIPNPAKGNRVSVAWDSCIAGQAAKTNRIVEVDGRHPANYIARSDVVDGLLSRDGYILSCPLCEHESSKVVAVMSFSFGRPRAPSDRRCSELIAAVLPRIIHFVFSEKNMKSKVNDLEKELQDASEQRESQQA